MKPTITIFLTSLLTINSAQSWLHCTSFNNTDLIEWIEGNATEFNGKMIVDPVGLPRHKANPENWINESSTYAWSPEATARAGGSIKLMLGGKYESSLDAWLTKKNLLQENGFAEESDVWPLDVNVTKAPTMKDRGNWQTVWLPEDSDGLSVIQGDKPS